MNVPIELNPELEKRLRDVAAKHHLDVHKFAPQAVQELLIHAVNWWPENQPNVQALLNETALSIRAQQEDHSAEGANNPVTDRN